MNQRSWYARPLQYTALAGYIVFLGFPLLWMLTIAFKTPTAVRRKSAMSPSSRRTSSTCTCGDFVFVVTENRRPTSPQPSCSAAKA